MEEEKREHDNKMKKMESEMEQVFEMKVFKVFLFNNFYPNFVVGTHLIFDQFKVREKKQKLRDSEAELARRHSATRRSLEQQARELEDRRRALDAERAAWELQAGVSLDDLRRRSLEANSKE